MSLVKSSTLYFLVHLLSVGVAVVVVSVDGGVSGDSVAEDSLWVSLGLTLDEVSVVVVGQGCVQTIVVDAADNWLDDSGWDNSLGHIWDVVGEASGVGDGLGHVLDTAVDTAV